MNPNGIINYLLQAGGLISQNIEWLGSRQFALFAVTLINIWSGYPFYMISILAGLQEYPQICKEASALDGANAVQTFTRITIPRT